MPSARPCAAFEPISPDLDVNALVESTPNFEYVVRIHCDMIDHQGLENFEKLVLLHVILGGKPLVIEGYQDRLDKWTFALQWLRDNCATKVENARDLTKKVNLPLSIGHYLNNMALLTNQWNTHNYKDPKRQRIYLKDIDCPRLWHEKLQELVPLGLFYLNDSTGDLGGIGALDEPDPQRPGIRKGRGIAKAGDLMSSLPPEMRAENLMCYIGHEGTYTPSHREMCASLGQNIMVETSTGAIEDGKPTKPGSSIWLMTESKEREVVSEYWLSTLGHDIEVENHFAQINAWKAAPFKTYVVEQRVGDFILIPPLAPHQVWNRGTRTMKVAWNRTTVETLEMALNEALPHARMVCRDEQYKNKAIIYYTMNKYSKLLKMAEKQKQKRSGSKRQDTVNAKIRQLEKDFRRLQALYTQVLISESFFPKQEEKNVELVPFDSNITCSYCRCNIFNRFLTCPSCVGELSGGEEDTYDICMECYAMGRSCACISKLKWVEQFPWNELVQKHEQFRHQIIQFEGQITEKSPKALKTELERLGKKRTLAQICQLELKKRPWRDIKKPAPATNVAEKEEEVEIDANGNPKKKRKLRRSDKFTREHKACHVDKYWEPRWKQAECSKCGESFCYGTLFRGYDMMPQEIMADPNWQCPKCLHICNCRNCRKKPDYRPYIPNGTRLGHNTKIIADPRSVESLVDFSYSNLSWIQKAGDDTPHDTRRLKKRIRAADKAKAQGAELGEDYADSNDTADGDQEVEENLLRLAQHEGIPIDPALDSPSGNGQMELDSQDEEDRYNENPEEFVVDMDPSLRSSQAAPYIVPAGGIIRDSEHAYGTTEMITYDYPDPEWGQQALVPEAEENIEVHPPEHDTAVPLSPSHIEMTSAKRKRSRLDEGDRPYNSKKASSEKAKRPKQRPSLVVKLPINKTKLGELNKIAMIAQHALHGVEGEDAPVIGSDLRALNADWHGPEGAAPRKKVRLADEEILDEEDDDEFTVGRRRDRRKSGTNVPPPDEHTRRVTRVKPVTYEDPSEDEFDETVENTARHGQESIPSEVHVVQQDSQDDAAHSVEESRPSTSDAANKSRATEPVAVSDDSEMHAEDEHVQTTPTAQGRLMNGGLSIRAFSEFNQETSKNGNVPNTEDSSLYIRNAATHYNRGLSNQPNASTAKTPLPTDASVKDNAEVTRLLSNKAQQDRTRAMALAAANRKAKLAAVKSLEEDSEDWSEPEDLIEQSAGRPGQNQSKPAAQRPGQTGFKAPTIAPIKAAPVLTASADDWGDSSSDDERAQTTKGRALTASGHPVVSVNIRKSGFIGSSAYKRK